MTLTSADDVDIERQLTVEAFLSKEARLLDQRLYSEWEQLWHDDGFYWVPSVNEERDDPGALSIIRADRQQIAARVRRFESGNAFTAEPVPQLARMVTNSLIEVESSGDHLVESAFLLVASRLGEMTPWAGHVRHRLRPDGGQTFQIVEKTVVLVNRADPLPTFAYLL